MPAYGGLGADGFIVGSVNTLVGNGVPDLAGGEHGVVNEIGRFIYIVFTDSGQYPCMYKTLFLNSVYPISELPAVAIPAIFQTIKDVRLADYIVMRMINFRITVIGRHLDIINIDKFQILTVLQSVDHVITHQGQRFRCVLLITQTPFLHINGLAIVIQRRALQSAVFQEFGKIPPRQQMPDFSIMLRIVPDQYV